MDELDEPTRPFLAQTVMGLLQSAIYVVAAALLIAAAAFTCVGTVTDLVEGRGSRPIADAGVFVLDRVLLLFILAELLYTLRLIDRGGRILTEPFLLIGVIAIIRRVLVLVAEVEQRQGREAVEDFVIEMAGLGGLALVLILAIYLLRRSAALRTVQPGGVS
jgi:uncharacterized membrane protein (DUF373 family)